MIIRRFQMQGIHQQGGQGGHIEEPVKSALSLAGRCIHGEPTGEPTHGNLMVGKAGTRMSYHSSGGAPIASRRPSLQRLAMVGSCVLWKAEAAAPPPPANQWQHHLENVYISRILGLILTYLQYILDLF
jgi:hypothetical protein